MASFSLYLRACVFHWNITDERKRRSSPHSSFLSNFVATVFIVLNINKIMSLIFNTPAAVISTVSTSLSEYVPLKRPSTCQIVACRAVRRLTNFTYDGPKITWSVLLSQRIMLVPIDLLVLMKARLIICPSPESHVIHKLQTHAALRSSCPSQFSSIFVFPLTSEHSNLNYRWKPSHARKTTRITFYPR